MNYKTIFLIGAFCMVFSVIIQAQTIKFCTSPPQKGECYGKELFSGTDSTEVFVMINNEEEINSTRVDLKIYKVENEVETYDATIDIPVESNWGWFFRGVIFYDSGVYKVYAYKADGTYLCSGSIKVTIDYTDEYDWLDY